MQQQISQQEQYGHQQPMPQQMAQPVMLCPIQYVYETPMLVQPEEHTQQPQPYLLNVQNPPPWIQNRQQNQVVYVQQVPNNIQQFIHPQMIQNQLYHQQIGYQIPQMMVPQEIRPVMQIPNLPQYNAVQNPTQSVQTEDTPEKMPLLTQMLNQKVNNVHNVQINPNIRPVMQNQQVQTEISSPGNRGRPKKGPRPQVITINPMQQRSFAPPPKQDVMINVARPLQPNIRQEIPTHLRNKIPSSISVKTIFRPILPRPMMRPYEVPNTQNFYFNPSFVNMQEITKNGMINTDNNMFVQPKILNNDKPEISAMKTFKNEEQQIMMAPSNVDNVDKQNPDPIVTKVIKINQSQPKVATETQTEEKLIRNTVFVQARGRVLNDKEIVINNLKRTLDDRLQERGEHLVNQDAAQSPKKMFIKIDPPPNNLPPNLIPIMSNVPMSLNSKMMHPQMYVVPENRVIETNISESKPITQNVDLNKNEGNLKDDSKLKVNKVPEINIEKKKENKTTSHTNIVQHKEEIREKITSDVSKEQSKDITKDKNDSKENLKAKDIHKKDEKIIVLTHVLDGHIIQESNVAFPIQKPTKEIDSENHKTSPKSATIDNKRDVIPHLPLSYQHLTKNIESEEEMEFAVNETIKDSPFANLQKSVVRSWTANQLADHLSKHGWKETSSKLLDQEIDGESILLVNKDQLIIIGICEDHADIISEFVGSSNIVKL